MRRHSKKGLRPASTPWNRFRRGENRVSHPKCRRRMRPVEGFRTFRGSLLRALPVQGSRSVCLLSYHQAISSLLCPRRRRLVGQVISLPTRAIMKFKSTLSLRLAA